MFIDKNSVIINNIVMGQYLTRAKFGYYKTWSSDTGYNLANEFTGTFTGLFPTSSNIGLILSAPNTVV